jgi:chromosome segregation ATPase
MALLSFIEASRAFNIAESTLRYWVTSNKLQAQTEVRNGKEITVLDEDEILLVKSTKANSSQVHTEGEYEGLPPAVQMYEQKLVQRDEQIQTLNRRIEELQYSLGQAAGEALQLKERLQEKAVEIVEWKKEVAAAREQTSKPWWKFWK